VMLVHAAGREKRRTYHVDLVLVVGVRERACRAGGGGVPSSIVSMWCPSPFPVSRMCMLDSWHRRLVPRSVDDHPERQGMTADGGATGTDNLPLHVLQLLSDSLESHGDDV